MYQIPPFIMQSTSGVR